METSPRDAAERAREQQRGWYGEPLGELCRGLIAGLGLNQARLAAVLGLSAPMLSQLMSGQRSKIGNPAVVVRLQSMRDLAHAVAEGSVPADQAAARMEEIRASAGSALLGTSTAGGQPTAGGPAVRSAPPVGRVVREIQSLLRALASAEELLDAADTLTPGHPGLAEFLRVYGTGRTDDAVAHFETHQD